MKALVKTLLVLLFLLIPAAMLAEGTPEQYAAAFGDYTRTEMNRFMETKGKFSPNKLTSDEQKESLPKDANGKYIVPEGAVTLGTDEDGSSTYILPRDGVKVLRGSAAGGELQITRVQQGMVEDQDSQRLQFRLDGANSTPTLEEGEKVLMILGENDFSVGAVHSFSGGLLTLKSQEETDHTLFTYAESFHLSLGDGSIVIPIEDIDIPLQANLANFGHMKMNGAVWFTGHVDGAIYPLFIDVAFGTKLDFSSDENGEEKNHIEVDIESYGFELTYPLIPMLKWELIPGLLEVNFSPSFFVEANGTGEIDFKFDYAFGFSYYHKVYLFEPDDIRNETVSEGPNFPYSTANVIGSIYAGLEWGPELEVLEGLLSVGLVYKGGAEFTGTLNPGGFNPLDPVQTTWHACDVHCFQGNGHGKIGPLSAIAKCFCFSDTLFNMVEPIVYDPFLLFYHSGEFGDGGWGTCPHHAWRLNVGVIDSAGQAIPGATVSYAPTTDHYDLYTSCVTGSDGIGRLYIPYDHKINPASPDVVNVTASITIGGKTFTDTKPYTAQEAFQALILQLETRSVTITFEDPGATQAQDMPAPLTYYLADTSGVALPSAEPRKSGRHFKGWNTEKDGSGTWYAKGQFVTSSQDMTLYAQFEAINETYVVLYDANGGTYAPMPQVTKLGEATALRTEPARWSGHNFLGWSYEDGSAEVAFPYGSVNLLTNPDNRRTVTLYAVWGFDPVELPVKLTYDMNGGPEEQKPPDKWVEKNGWLPISQIVPVWNRLYTFHGWSEDKNALYGEYAPGEVIMMTGNKTLYAIWTYDPAPRPVFITFEDSGSGTAYGLPPRISAVPGVSVSLPDRIPRKSGLHFIGWNTSPDGSGTFYGPGSSAVFAEDTTLYAQWKVIRNSFVVLYNANGGMSAPQPQVFGLDEVPILTDMPASWSNHNFLGWALKDDAFEPDYPYGRENILRNPEGKPLIELYAVWGYSPVDLPVRLTYDMNGAPEEKRPADQWIASGGQIALYDETPAWDGQHIFLGWSESRDRTAVLYKPGDVIRLRKDTKLYAIWQADYTIIQGNGSVWNPQNRKGVRFVADGDLRYFYYLEIDGKVIYRTQYTLSSGSTVADLPANLLGSLGEGTHTIRFVYHDGAADGTFTVTRNVPQTGDSARPVLWLIMILFGIVAFIKVLKKR